MAVVLTVAFAPAIVYGAFAQTYNIAYFGLIEFSFPSAMIILLTTTGFVVSVNFGFAFGRRKSATEHAPSVLNEV
jgi:hypothetical protein